MLLVLLVVLVFISFVIGLELGERVGKINPKLAGRVWFVFPALVFYGVKYWRQTKFLYVAWLASSLSALVVLGIFLGTRA